VLFREILRSPLTARLESDLTSIELHQTIDVCRSTNVSSCTKTTLLIAIPFLKPYTLRHPLAPSARHSSGPPGSSGQSPETARSALTAVQLVVRELHHRLRRGGGGGSEAQTLAQALHCGLVSRAHSSMRGSGYFQLFSLVRETHPQTCLLARTRKTERKMSTSVNRIRAIPKLREAAR